MKSDIDNQNEEARYLHLLNRWKDFRRYYNMVSSHIELINTEGMELSRFVWVTGFEEAGLDERHMIKHFTGKGTEEKGRN